jgi:hypothetical protein
LESLSKIYCLKHQVKFSSGTIGKCIEFFVISYSQEEILNSIADQQMSRASESVNIPAEGQVVKDAEIIIVDRSEILLMPFFDSAILGLVHQQGVIVPLVSLK